MITNKNMSNEELVDKLIDGTANLMSKKNCIGVRDIKRLSNVRKEILNRMDEPLF